jgi:cell division transport system permease protein
MATKRGNRRRTVETKKPRAKTPRTETRRTQRAGGNLVDKISAFRDLHASTLLSSLGRLTGSPFSTMMTTAVLAIAIALASSFYLLLANVEQLTGNLAASTQISLFLKDSVSDARAQKLAEEIKQNPAVGTVTVISKNEALAEFKTYSGFGAAINVLKSNPLPVVLQVMPKADMEQVNLEQLLATLQQNDNVDLAQMDMQWLNRLHSIMDLAERLAILLNGLLGFAVLFIAGNTIRLELHKRQEEVVIARLVGATDAFIERPFLYSGFWLGLLSGIGAVVIDGVLLMATNGPVAKLANLYGGNFRLMFFSFGEMITVLALSAALGVIGSWVVLRFQLHSTELD